MNKMSCVGRISKCVIKERACNKFLSWKFAAVDFAIIGAAILIHLTL